jgi:hypothetical protein
MAINAQFALVLLAIKARWLTPVGIPMISAMAPTTITDIIDFLFLAQSDIETGYGGVIDDGL